MKIVHDYTGLNFLEILDIDVIDFWRYLHDAVVYNCSLTENGREYLEKAYYYQKNKGISKPDRLGLAEFVNG